MFDLLLFSGLGFAGLLSVALIIAAVATLVRAIGKDSKASGKKADKFHTVVWYKDLNNRNQ